MCLAVSRVCWSHHTYIYFNIKYWNLRLLHYTNYRLLLGPRPVRVLLAFARTQYVNKMWFFCVWSFIHVYTGWKWKLRKNFRNLHFHSIFLLKKICFYLFDIRADPYYPMKRDKGSNKALSFCLQNHCFSNILLSIGQTFIFHCVIRDCWKENWSLALRGRHWMGVGWNAGGAEWMKDQTLNRIVFINQIQNFVSLQQNVFMFTPYISDSMSCSIQSYGPIECQNMYSVPLFSSPT